MRKNSKIDEIKRRYRALRDYQGRTPEEEIEFENLKKELESIAEKNLSENGKVIKATEKLALVIENYRLALEIDKKISEMENAPCVVPDVKNADPELVALMKKWTARKSDQTTTISDSQHS